MATILQFPLTNNNQHQHLPTCAGCHQSIKGDYWKIGVPQQTGSVEQLALCDQCHEETMQHGIFM